MVIEAELNEIIQAAVNQRASDIYWLPTAEGYQVLVQAAGSWRLFGPRVVGCPVVV